MNFCITYINDLKNQKELLLNSIISCRKIHKDIDIYICTNNLNIDIKCLEFFYNYNCNIININKYCENYFNNNFIINNTVFTVHAFAKLLIPLIYEFKKYENVLYIDPDTIFRKNVLCNEINTQKDCTLFYSIHHAQKSDFYIHINELRDKILNISKLYLNDYAINKFNYIYNTGVILFHIKNISLQKYKNLIYFINMIYDPKLFRNAEQDLINYYLNFNISNLHYNDCKLDYDPYILHVWGSFKYKDYYKNNLLKIEDILS